MVPRHLGCVRRINHGRGPGRVVVEPRHYGQLRVPGHPRPAYPRHLADEAAHSRAARPRGQNPGTPRAAGRRPETWSVPVRGACGRGLSAAASPVSIYC
ncbi:hypothetical protein BC828DRAFT_383107 [Blastocladiella britannica]|nr:hypothetical protein BC828DRAFT_383107 [Blastocladiella britannica]